MGCFRTDANNFLCNSAVLTMAWYQKFLGSIDLCTPPRKKRRTDGDDWDGLPARSAVLALQHGAQAHACQTPAPCVSGVLMPSPSELQDLPVTLGLRPLRERALPFIVLPVSWPSPRRKMLFFKGVLLAGTQCVDRFWQGLDRYMPATIHSKKDAGVNPRVLIYLYSFVWRSQLKIDCDFRKQLRKVC